MDNNIDYKVKPDLIRDIIKLLNFEPEDKFFNKRTDLVKKSLSPF